MDLVTFLTARLDDDEERARFVQRQTEGNNWQPFEDWRLSWHDEYDLLCIEPSRALGEVEAKRAIVAIDPEDTADPALIREILARTALIYAEHPDYLQEWRP